MLARRWQENLPRIGLRLKFASLRSSALGRSMAGGRFCTAAVRLQPSLSDYLNAWEAGKVRPVPIVGVYQEAASTRPMRRCHHLLVAKCGLSTPHIDYDSYRYLFKQPPTIKRLRKSMAFWAGKARRGAVIVAMAKSIRPTERRPTDRRPTKRRDFMSCYGGRLVLHLQPAKGEHKGCYQADGSRRRPLAFLSHCSAARACFCAGSLAWWFP